MPHNSFSIQPFEAKRVRFDSTRSFDEVLLNLRKLVGTATLQEVNKQEAGGVTREHFETLGEEYIAAMQRCDCILHSFRMVSKSVESDVHTCDEGTSRVVGTT